MGIYVHGNTPTREYKHYFAGDIRPEVDDFGVLRLLRLRQPDQDYRDIEAVFAAGQWSYTLQSDDPEKRDDWHGSEFIVDRRR